MDYKEHNKQVDEQMEEVLKKKEELLELLDQQENKLKQLSNNYRYDTKISFLDGTEDVISSNKYNDWSFIKKEIKKKYGYNHFKAFNIDENVEHNFYSKKHPENLLINILSIDDIVKEFLSKNAKYRKMTDSERQFKTGGKLFEVRFYRIYEDFVILNLKKGYRFNIEKRTPKTLLLDAGNWNCRKNIKNRTDGFKYNPDGYEFIEYEGYDYIQLDEEFDTDLEYIVVEKQ